jgi:O-antigen/teichoic acid export membrane protein
VTDLAAGPEAPAPVARPLGRNMATILTSRTLTMGIQFVAFGLLAANLGPSRLGIYAFALAFASMFNLLTDIGLRSSLTRDAAQRPGDEAHLVPNVAYLRLALAPLAYGLMVAVLFGVSYTTDQRRAALAAGLLVFIQPFEVFQSTLEIHLKMRWSALADVVESVLALSGIVYLVHRHASVESFIWLYVVVNALNIFGVALASSLVTRYRWRPQPRTWRPLARTAIPLGVAALFMALYYRLDIAILSVVHRGAAVGEYGAGYRFFEAYTVVAGVLLSVLTPVLARSVVQDRSIALRRYQRALYIMLLLALPVAIGGAATATRLIPTLPGFDHFRGAGVTLAYLAPGAAAVSLCSVVQAMLIGAHGQRRLLMIAATCLAANVGLNFALIPPFTYAGAAVATTITECLVLVLSARAVTALLGRGFPVANVMRALRASVVLAIALLLTAGVHPYTQVAVGVVVYLLALMPTGSLRWSDLGGVLNHADGMRAEVDTIAPAHPRRDTRVVVAGTPLGVFRQLRGCRECIITGPVPGWVGPVARMARCGRVVDATGRRRRGWQRLFLDAPSDH